MMSRAAIIWMGFPGCPGSAHRAARAILIGATIKPGRPTSVLPFRTRGGRGGGKVTRSGWMCMIFPVTRKAMPSLTARMR